MKVSFYYFVLFLCPFVYAAPPILKSVLMYSAENVILSDSDLHVFYLDLKCFAALKGDFLLDVDQPDFEDTTTGAYFFVSKGPAPGKYAPWPDPNDSTTYQWSTKNKTGPPLPGFTISNAGGQNYYASINCPNGRFCTYTLVTEYDPTSKKKIEARNNRINFAGSFSETDQVKAVTQQPLFFSNRMETDGVVDHQEWVQYEVPLCASALISQFNSSICLAFTVVGLSPDFIFYQQVSLDPAPDESVVKWNTRQSDSNPYADYSGKSTLPINRWRSTPVSPKDVPTSVYHSIVGQGGKGLAPPHTNKFVAFYEFIPCKD